VLAHHALKLFQVSPHLFLICRVVVLLELDARPRTLRAQSNQRLQQIAMDMAPHASFSQRQVRHE
jgi:hypothetical protein